MKMPNTAAWTLDATRFDEKAMVANLDIVEKGPVNVIEELRKAVK